MEESIEKNRIPEDSFPSLLIRHSEAITRDDMQEIDYHIQAHENYMYTFFKHIKKEAIYKIKVDNHEGYSFAPIQVKNISLRHSLNEKEYFRFLLNAPLPFLFIPSSKLREHSEMCKDAHYFQDGNQEGILMDLNFACQVGLDFMAAEYLKDPNVSSIYIGLVVIH